MRDQDDFKVTSHAPKWWWGFVALTTVMAIVFVFFADDLFGLLLLIGAAVLAIFAYVQAIRATIRSRNH
ncbi:hypothetical protein J2X85_001430 [Microbacterium trichothecenolyticum]|uniref:hypothetical protein n=1 Tax=Microbacterium trichothecenolyticum TaxID=69370 RepID=UPI0028678B34|nr:hypothetical protein [Microbacterium trichothecenolyticum]MDR7184407.1 hypothetical protein [Microbacterium trichothecenolyticum]